jgi:hypothetical protein
MKNHRTYNKLGKEIKWWIEGNKAEITTYLILVLLTVGCIMSVIYFNGGL